MEILYDFFRLNDCVQKFPDFSIFSLNVLGLK